MYKSASRIDLKIPSTKGNLNVNDLWNLTLQQLNVIAKDLKKQLKETSEEDFLNEKSNEDEILNLRFKIVLDVLETKKKEKQDAEVKATNKAEVNKLLEIIEKKQNESLNNLSLEELLKKVKELQS